MQGPEAVPTSPEASAQSYITAASRTRIIAVVVLARMLDVSFGCAPRIRL
jgi:hypothetical protein